MAWPWRTYPDLTFFNFINPYILENWSIANLGYNTHYSSVIWKKSYQAGRLYTVKPSCSTKCQGLSSRYHHQLSLSRVRCNTFVSHAFSVTRPIVTSPETQLLTLNEYFGRYLENISTGWPKSGTIFLVPLSSPNINRSSQNSRRKFVITVLGLPWIHPGH